MFEFRYVRLLILARGSHINHTMHSTLIHSFPYPPHIQTNKCYRRTDVCVCVYLEKEEIRVHIYKMSKIWGPEVLSLSKAHTSHTNTLNDFRTQTSKRMNVNICTVLIYVCVVYLVVYMPYLFIVHTQICSHTFWMLPVFWTEVYFKDISVMIWNECFLYE